MVSKTLPDFPGDVGAGAAGLAGAIWAEGFAAWGFGAGASSPQPASRVIEKDAIQSRVVNCFTG